MLVAERQQKIVEIVNMRSSIRVSELSDIFSVTEETIRRDLEKLEKEHKLSRSHGGAVSIQQQESEVHFSEREITNVIEKSHRSRSGQICKERRPNHSRCKHHRLVHGENTP